MASIKYGKSLEELGQLIAKRPAKNEYKEVEVIANFLEVTKFQYPKVKSYTVDVITDRRAKASKKDSTAAILELLKDTKFGPAAYDGQLLYSVADLIHGSNARKFDVTVEPQDGAGRAKRLTVIIKFSYNYTLKEMSNYMKRNTKQTWDASIQNIFTILNAFLNTKVCTKYQSVGSRFIFPQPTRLQDRVYLYGGVELIHGFYQSFRPGWDRRAKASKKDSTAAILELLKDTKFGPAAYDGQLLYSVADLIHGSNARKFDVTVEPQDGAGRAKRLTVIIKFSYNYTLKEMSNYMKRNTKQTWDASIQNIFTILNAFLNTKVCTKYQSVGSRFIFPQPTRLQDRVYLYGGVELIHGFYQSFRPGWDKLLINVIDSGKIYYPAGNFIDIIPRILYTAQNKRLKTRDELRSGLTANEIATIAKFLQNRDFTTTYAARNQKKN
ncbi:hypothetical protein Glove_87g182 [Diversispora epigaea]|uniref:Argonaute linker 1 domain-containing protein n=1 Tax=Diversispora epigaea TaxID=1348612 RepID=A0A397J9Y0_9GLOM|nr:hypothetical protein Glove_87g182 [Diversispora epigaea]